jgi:hypothetical protein
MAETVFDRVRRLTRSLDDLVTTMEQSGSEAPVGAAIGELDAALGEARGALGQLRAQRVSDIARALTDEGSTAGAALEAQRLGREEDRLETSIAELQELRCRLVADLAAFFAACRTGQTGTRQIEGHMHRARVA